MSFAQGDIIKLNFDPTLGHEQAGYRPAVVISRKMFNQRTGHLTVCPITSTSRTYPTWVALDGKTATHGYVLCEQVKTIDADARNPVFIEKIDENVLAKILAIVGSIIQKDE
ncbi:MAG: type II toxin-antitoxin system PemK/MazF family toxin [Oscillospiraceae bacterium]|jgi:mRNA interferase MazF|nr:type II toxin-antitoxin system PemK/MazF family toxin [Oscillospiraceae bacterium]